MNEVLANQLAFAGSAFLSSDAARLADLLEGLREAQEEIAALLLALRSGDIDREYVRLFYDPLGAVCPPWQSARGEEPRLMGESHVSATGWYRQAGLEPQLSNEPADHIGLLLLFAAHLVRHEPAALARFQAEHLAWMPEYLNQLAGATKHPFYAGLAAFTAARLDAISSSPTPATA
ncbi:MAG: molecular chaperone TorD family protein [Bryobacterales bacterium]|nr:molecular chaperone TorD family protein [Bryobacterales bacterium]